MRRLLVTSCIALAVIAAQRASGPIAEDEFCGMPVAHGPAGAATLIDQDVDVRADVLVDPDISSGSVENLGPAKPYVIKAHVRLHNKHDYG